MCTNKKVCEIIKSLKKGYPNTKCDLNFSNPLEILVATIKRLAVQTKDHPLAYYDCSKSPHYSAGIFNSQFLQSFLFF